MNTSIDFTGRHKVIVVDDMPENIILATELLEDEYEVLTASDGSEALELIYSNPDLDAIILDVMMPGMSGFEVCRRVKENQSTTNIPIIFLTALDNSEYISRGLKLGAYYYLVKPIEPLQLISIVAAAAEHSITYKQLRKSNLDTLKSLSLVEQSRFRFRTLEDVYDLAVLASNAHSDSECVIMGITELLLNAVEHGNLGITYNDKTELYKTGDWEAEIRRRLDLHENLDKFAFLNLENTDNFFRITVLDQGNGFDWEQYLEFSPDRVLDSHGRGIAMANNTCFDQLEFQGTGNEVVATIYKS